MRDSRGEIRRPDRAGQRAYPGRPAGHTGPGGPRSAGQWRRTRAGRPVAADQGPAGQWRRTRASGPGPARRCRSASAGRPRDGRPVPGRASAGRGRRAARAVRLSGQPSAPALARRHRPAGQRTRQAGDRHTGHRHHGSSTQDSNGGQHSAGSRTGRRQARTGHQARRGRGAGHPAAGPGGQLRHPAGAAAEGRTTGRTPGSAGSPVPCPRLRRKQLATQDVSRRLAYPLALLPGVQQEL